MTTSQNPLDRRNFMKTAATLSTGVIGFSCMSQSTPANAASSLSSVFVIGPIEGYSPQIGTLVSMLNYNRFTIVEIVKSMTMEQIDYLHDEKANTIGALLMHLGATEKYYQANTFEGRQNYNDEEIAMWGPAMDLGDKGRDQLKGQEVQYYLDAIDEVRQKTLEEFKTKDDDWLLTIDPEWSKERPLNTYWKWFHVCEHEANHRGQIAWLRSRLPGAESGNN